MKFSIRFADQIVGALVILALAILVFVIFMLGSSQRWFSHDYQYKSYFNSAAGLSTNMALQYKGFTIGNVKKISLAENDNVEVSFVIFEEYHQRVREGSLVEVIVSPIGLGNSFIFHPGRGSELIQEGMEIPEVNSVRGKQIIAARMVDRLESSDGISNIISQVNVVLSDLSALVRTIDVSLAGSDGADELTLGQILLNVESVTADITSLVQNIDGNLSPVFDNVQTVFDSVQTIFDDIQIIFGDVQTVTDQLADPSGTVMSILGTDGTLYTNIADAIESLAGIIENLEKTSAFLPAQLPQIGVIINDIGGLIRSVQDVLVSVANNPLLRGGIPEHRIIGPGAANPRDMEF